MFGRIAASTLQPLTYMVEAVAMGFYTLSVTAYEAFVPFIWYLLTAIGIVVGFILLLQYHIRVYGPALRIRILLECTQEEAEQVNDYLNEVGITWHKYHRWVATCMGKLMPLLSFRQKPYDDQLVATWGESKRAMLKLSLEKRLDPKWSPMDAVGAASAEILKERMARGSDDIFNPSHDLEDE